MTPGVAAQSWTEVTGGVVLDRRSIYILPTSWGVLFMAVVALVLVGAINYDTSLAYLLAFILSGVFLLAPFYTYRNLAGLEVRVGPADDVFAGDSAIFPVTVHCPADRDRMALALCMRARRRRYARSGTAADPASCVAVDVPSGESRGLQLIAAARRRGRLEPGPVTISSRYPLGLFVAWSRIESDADCFVYPAPAGTIALPEEASTDARDAGGTRPGSDDFAGLRPYVPGDSPRQISWKTLARSDDVQVKRFTGNGSAQLWLRFELTAGTVDERLGQLARWIVAAERLGLAYGLRLPGLELAPDSGAGHQQRCLRALALFEPETGA